MMFRAATIFTCLFLGAQAGAAARAKEAVPVTDWRRVATPSDVSRLHDWRDAFVQGLSAARTAGFAGEIAREGALLDPDAGLDAANLPAGRYRCRTIKLGSKGGASTYAVGSAADCRVTDEGEVQSLSEINGMQRPTGLLFAGDGRRRVFLGTMMLGDETRPMQYGQDDGRDMAGAVERIGASRWRLVLPYPRFESIVDVVELVPSS